MNVLLIHQVFISPQETGGTRHYELGRHLVQRGHKFTVVASNLSYLTGKSTSAGDRLITEQHLDGMRVLRAYTYPSLHRSFAWRIFSFISFMLSAVYAGLVAGPVDVVIGTSPPIFQAVSAWFVALLRRRPFLLEIRDLWPEFAVGMGVLTNPVLIALSRLLERFLYSRANHFLVNSPAYRDYLIEKGIPPRKITVIPNGVDPAMFDPAMSGAKLREEFSLDGEFVVTYAGALGMANDIPTILKAADLLRDDADIRFMLVGDGKERHNLEAQASAMALPNVIFAGPRPKSEMPEFLAGSDACVATLMNIPMFSTTYPNKVFDYMASGKPTLLAIDGVIRQVMDRAGGGIFVPPGDANALAAAVQTLARDRPRGQALGAAARAYVVEHFDRRRQADQFVALIEGFGRRKKNGR